MGGGDASRERPSAISVGACFPHGVFPRLVRTVLPVLNEVGLRDLRQQPTPCRFKRTPRHVKASRCPARAQDENAL